MTTILSRVSTAALALALLATPAIAAGTSVIPEAAGSTEFPGSHSASRANSDRDIDATYSASDMAHSSAELPNNDASTPINSGPGKVGAPRPLAPGNNMLEGGTHGVAGVNGGVNASAGATLGNQ